MIGNLLQQTSEWVTRLVWVNLLWLLFIGAGLGVFGFMPATIALFTVTRKWTMGDFDISPWKIFNETFKKEFLRANLAGAIFVLLGLFIYFDLKVAEMMPGIFSIFLYAFFLFLALVLLFTLIYFFPLYVHYHLSMKDYFKQAFIYSIVSPATTLLMTAGLFCIGYLIYHLPGLIPFISGVMMAYWIINVCMKRFRRLEEAASL
ncbi:putative membrane protein YesL [Bacillus pakistanensis]|uniref:Membrane protein YesL n=1 Tax=Rossellomorea pakistanensis TaxID=992288 RepID=A0ABS2NCM2_9BACI|nr:YesL family protein [Bacillus pakistanensis]MBM7585597.1 putative membrane protein YesL [Bacillus pakistanensis]